MAAIAERKEDLGGWQGRLCLRKQYNDEQIAAVAGAALSDTFIVSAHVRKATIIKQHR